MPWLSPSQDPTFAELASRANISGGGGISSALLQPRRNQWEELLKTVAPILRDYMQKKKSDEIANQFQNMYQPPRAEAVDPSMQGLPPTEPFTGGADQFKVAEMYRQRMEHTEDRDLNRRYKEAQINAKGESRVPVEAGGRTYNVTDNDALKHYRETQKSSDGLTPYQREQLRRGETDKLHKSIPPYSRALRRGKIEEDGDFTNNYEGAANGDYAEVLTPDGSKIIVPWTEYERATKGKTTPAVPNPAAQSYQEIQKQSASPNDSDADAIRAAYKAGQLSKEEAVDQLRKLGFE